MFMTRQEIEAQLRLQGIEDLDHMLSARKWSRTGSSAPSAKTIAALIQQPGHRHLTGRKRLQRRIIPVAPQALLG
jgi:hypothetical protein